VFAQIYQVRDANPRSAGSPWAILSPGRIGTPRSGWPRLASYLFSWAIRCIATVLANRKADPTTSGTCSTYFNLLQFVRGNHDWSFHKGYEKHTYIKRWPPSRLNQTCDLVSTTSLLLEEYFIKYAWKVFKRLLMIIDDLDLGAISYGNLKWCLSQHWDASAACTCLRNRICVHVLVILMHRFHTIWCHNMPL